MAVKLVDQKNDIKIKKVKETKNYINQTMILPKQTYKDKNKKISKIEFGFDTDDINEIVEENYDFVKGDRYKIDVLTDYGWLSGKVFAYENAQSLDVYDHRRDGNSAGLAEHGLNHVYAIVVNEY